MLHLRLIILSVEGNVPVDSESLLVTDFVNLKIKPVQSFGCAHRDRVCVRVYIHMSECSYVYKYLYLYCVSKKRNMYMSLDFKRCIVYSPLPVCLKIVTLYCFQIYSNLSLFSYTQPHEKKGKEECVCTRYLT
jgi:hypothetical protein